jgi:phosphate:Na+ symporter
MSATAVLLNIMGDVALLLWGIHMVQTGVMRTFGADLRRVLAHGLSTRLRALLAGAGVTAALQSSTATALMTASLAANGLVDLVTALAVMLGANIGTTLIVLLLSFDITLIFPMLLVGGLVAFRNGGTTRMHDLGRVAIGLGLMLLALHLLAVTIQPAEESRAARDILTAITNDPLLNFALAALFAWAAHSSVAAVLAIISLTATGIAGPEAALAMVLGANVGTSINPIVEGSGGDPVKLRLPLGNFAMRALMAVALLPILGPVSRGLATIDPNGGRAVAEFHLLFNLAVALVFAGLLPHVARLLVRLLPRRELPPDPSVPQYLDRDNIDVPAVALTSASREVLRMADVVESMLTGARAALHADDRKRIAETARRDDVVDRLHQELQSYVALVAEQGLTGEEEQRLSEVQAFAINLEHVGDIIDRNLSELITKCIRLKLSLSPEGLDEIDGMFSRLLDHLRLAVAVFMSNDVSAARRLVAEKEQFRELERESTERHFLRVRAGRPASVETSGLHLDLVRDLKRIDAHLAATAHPLLERIGVLRSTRLAS